MSSFIHYFVNHTCKLILFRFYLLYHSLEDETIVNLCFIYTWIIMIIIFFCRCDKLLAKRKVKDFSGIFFYSGKLEKICLFYVSLID